MKRLLLSLMLALAVMGASAMSFERARQEALYLTDKMAYELNLNDQQYNDAYEINLDYFLRVDSPADVYGSYYDYRLYDLRCILHDWQYALLSAADYFLRPVVWRAGGWHFPIYSYYNRDYFYYGRPSVWISYRGGHSRFYHHAGFYANRRPHWDGGLRGHDMHRPSVGGHHASHGGGMHGNGYHIDLGGHRGGAGSGGHGSSHGGVNQGGGHQGGGSYGGGRGSQDHSSVGHGGQSSSHSGVGASHGNSFDGSSSRMSGGSRTGTSRGSAGMGSSRSSSGPSVGGASRGGGSSRGSGVSRGGGGVSRGGRR